MSRSAWRNLAAALLIAVAAVFLGLSVARNWADLERHTWTVHWPLLAASVGGLTGVFAWSVVVWKLVLDRFEHPPVGIPTLLRIWFLSNLARYIPGKVWQFVGAAELARSAGLSRPVLLTSMVVQMGFTLLGAAVVSLLTLWHQLAAAGGMLTVLLPALAVLSVFLVHPAVLNAGLRLVPKVLSRAVIRWDGLWRHGLLLLALTLGSWLLYGVAFWLFVWSVTGVPGDAVLPLAGVNALSFLAGYLVFVTPAGLGAREGVMALLLRPYVPVGVAAMVAVLSRLWTVAAELLGALLVLALPRRTPAGHDA